MSDQPNVNVPHQSESPPISNTSTVPAQRLTPPPRSSSGLRPPPSNQNGPRSRYTFRPDQLPPDSPPSHRHRCGGCCCRCLFWSFMTLIILILLLGIAVAIFFAIYHPKHPTFSISSLRLSTFNLTSYDQLTTQIELNMSTKNPSSSGFSYSYSPIQFSIISSNQVSLGEGSFSAFVHGGGDTVDLCTTVGTTRKVLDGTAAEYIRSKSSLRMRVDLESKVGVKAGAMKTGKVRVRVSCGFLNVMLTGKNMPISIVKSPEVTCQVNVKIKIFKWYL